jgi:hypothetical protein
VVETALKNGAIKPAALQTDPKKPIRHGFDYFYQSVFRPGPVIFCVTSENATVCARK